MIQQFLFTAGFIYEILFSFLLVADLAEISSMSTFSVIVKTSGEVVHLCANHTLIFIHFLKHLTLMVNAMTTEYIPPSQRISVAWEKGLGLKTLICMHDRVHCQQTGYILLYWPQGGKIVSTNKDRQSGPNNRIVRDCYLIYLLPQRRKTESASAEFEHRT